MPVTDWGWLITPEEIESWIIHNDADVLAIHKPGLVLCHPSKHGPWSSLVGACREYLGVERLHMPSRLDRETSGVVVFAKHPAAASELQTAIEKRAVTKRYLAILHGELNSTITVDQPIGQHPAAKVFIRRAVVEGGQSATTEFEPLTTNQGYTLARVKPHTGRMHQIRVHAEWLGHPIVGDKIYGGDETLFLRFIDFGYTPELACQLEWPRHALHAELLQFHLKGGTKSFEAPLAPDLVELCRQRQLTLP